ncbi:MAG: hypothetical protein V2B13_20140 [Pseudomonadota bacterium]
MEDKQPSPPSPWRTHLLIICILFLLAPINLLSNFPHITTHIPGDVMDTAEYPLNEWWTAHALVDLKTNPFNNTYIFYPLGLNMVQHTYTFLDGLFFTILRPFVSLIVFHNLLVWMTFFANAMAAYLLIFYVTKIPGLAFIGALAFGHCPTLLSFYKTVSLLEIYNFIFFVLCSYCFVQQRRLIWVVPAGFFWGLTLYNYPYYFVFGGLWLFLLIGYQLCPWEIRIKTLPELRISFWARILVWVFLLGLMLFPIFAPRRLWELLGRWHMINWITLFVFGLLLIIIWTIFKFQALGTTGILKYFPVRWNPPPLRRIFLGLGFFGIAMGITTLIGFPYFYAYFKEEATRLAVSSHPAEFAVYSVDLVSFLAPFNAWLAGLYKIIAVDWKNGAPIVGTPAFPGYGFMMILFWGTGKFFKRPELRLWLVGWGLFTILSLGPYLKIHGLVYDSLPLPAYWIRYLPVIESGRTLSRYLAPAMLFLCLSICLILKPFYLKLSPLKKKIFLAGMLLMIGFEYGMLPKLWPLRFTDYRIPEVYQVLAQKARGRTGILLDLPLFIHSGARSAGHGETRRFYYQSVHKQKMIGGVSSKLDESVLVFFQNQPAVSKLWSLQPIAEDELTALVQTFNLNWIVLEKRYYPPETLKAYRSVLDSVPYVNIFYEDSRYLGMAIKKEKELVPGKT